MNDYLMMMKTTGDHLALVGAPMSTDELVLHTLNGLDVDYNHIVVKLFDQVGLTWVEPQLALLLDEGGISPRGRVNR
ncbi:hypothetical protein QN277_007758 [Acacia crassicarpa]|uniref:Uncharacterized protein n=1 Tax=Acacia crassicarpa TaxID=499986 RepID=A0AAE1IV39_9FABA|nr:hypothetical protein QN277_007758 [Acacia crassicarpa]